jgi:hypothetical protein
MRAGFQCFDLFFAFDAHARSNPYVLLMVHCTFGINFIFVLKTIRNYLLICHQFHYHTDKILNIN